MSTHRHHLLYYRLDARTIKSNDVLVAFFISIFYVIYYMERPLYWATRRDNAFWINRWKKMPSGLEREGNRRDALPPRFILTQSPSFNGHSSITPSFVIGINRSRWIQGPRIIFSTLQAVCFFLTENKENITTSYEICHIRYILDLHWWWINEYYVCNALRYTYVRRKCAKM